MELTVGFLPYPPDRPSRREPPSVTRLEETAALDPGVASVELDGPGFGPVRVFADARAAGPNRSGAGLAIATNGAVTASVVDPGTGEVVGGYAGWQTAPLVTFEVGPGETKRIPLLIGTASLAPRLGYAVPPGNWGLRAGLDLRDDSRGLTPVLPLTVAP